MQRFSPDPDSPYTIDECKIRGTADFVYIPDDEEELFPEDDEEAAYKAARVFVPARPSAVNLLAVWKLQTA